MPDRTVLLVDDDADVRDSLRALLESAGYVVRDFESAKGLLTDPALNRAGCLITDIRMPEMDGLALQEELAGRKIGLPVIVITGHGDVPLAVRAMKAGAVDFIEKPFDDHALIAAVRSALDRHAATKRREAFTSEAQSRLACLSKREREVLDGLVAGHPNKIIAADLGISPRTVEIYRANVMTKMQAESLSDLVRTALVAGLGGEAFGTERD
jgi:two-component system, LuxR family, response regulator FixJ